MKMETPGGGMNGAEQDITNGSRSSDHSAALAEKLLQGWALIQDPCPQCWTPLVRNRQGKMYCVACAQWVLSQTEAVEQLARERVENGGGGSTSEPAAHPLPLPEPSTFTIPKLNYRPKTLEQVLPNLSFILIHKLEEIGNGLLASQDVNETRMLMGALRECLETIKCLKH